MAEDHYLNGQRVLWTGVTSTQFIAALVRMTCVQFRCFVAGRALLAGLRAAFPGRHPLNLKVHMIDLWAECAASGLLREDPGVAAGVEGNDRAIGEVDADDLAAMRVRVALALADFYAFDCPASHRHRPVNRVVARQVRIVDRPEVPERILSRAAPCGIKIECVL